MRSALLFVFMLSCLTLFAQGRKLPPLSFKANSTAFADANRSYTNTGGYTQADTLTDEVILNSLAKIMELNPELVVKLTGHTNYDEATALGQQRAEVVMNELVERGISRERLETSNAGFSMPLLGKEIIEELPTKLEQLVANQRNRRVVVSVARTREDEDPDN